jgi:hypothetical protein
MFSVEVSRGSSNKMWTTELPGLTASTAWEAELSTKPWLEENRGPENGAVAWAAIVISGRVGVVMLCGVGG